MTAVQPFVEDYQNYPRGFAETDNLNDIEECQKIVDNMMWEFNKIMTAGEKRSTIKREIDRWSNEKNAGGFGRFIARLEYLKRNK